MGGLFKKNEENRTDQDGTTINATQGSGKEWGKAHGEKGAAGM